MHAAGMPVAHGLHRRAAGVWCAPTAAACMCKSVRMQLAVPPASLLPCAPHHPAFTAKQPPAATSLPGQAVVEVDEEGTVAAAATGIMMTRSMPMPAPELVFDRPFAFVIRHDATRLPVFVGVVHDPSSAGGGSGDK